MKKKTKPRILAASKRWKAKNKSRLAAYKKEDEWDDNE